MAYTFNDQNNSYVGTSGVLDTQILDTAETREDDTLAAISDLDITVAAYDRVWFRYTIFFDTPAGADFKFQVDVPASPSQFRQLSAIQVPEGAAFVTALIEAEASTAVTAAQSTLDSGAIIVTGILLNGANSGSIQFTCAQNADSGTTTIEEGCLVEYRKF